MPDRLSYAEINLAHYAYNFRFLKKLIGKKAGIMAVVKANAYGHGAIPIAKKALSLGASYIGVVCLYEAKELRNAAIKAPILIMNYSDAETASEAVKHDITLNVMDEKVLKVVDKVSRKLKKRTKIHVKIDTGMRRGGIYPQEALKFIGRIENYKNVFLEGIFTHFATSDEKDLAFTHEQLSGFLNLIKSLREKSINPPLIHSANSGASLRLSSGYFNLVRPGIVVYGLAPSLDFKLPFKLKPVMTLKSKIVQIKLLQKGDTVGYGRTFKAKRKMLMGLLPIGYGDGYPRALSNKFYVLVRGKKAPLLGRVSMDQTAVDISRIKNVKAGDEAVLIGRQGKETILADDIAKLCSTINYEIVVGIVPRIPRIYLNT